MTVAAVFVVYVATTGVIIQLIDMKALYTHAPPSDPTMQSIREGIMGPPGFQVIGTADYTAARLPEKVDLSKLFEVVRKAATAAAPSEPLKWIELRMDGNTPVGVVAMAGPNARRLKFSALTGESMGGATVESPFAMFARGPSSPHDLVKGLHRGDFIGHTGAVISLLVSLMLMVMVISGLVVYFKMLGSRQKSGRSGWFWR
jgi:uncharacterized iron-regulated membrane protein